MFEAADAAKTETVAMATGCADGLAHVEPRGRHLRTLRGHPDRLGRVAFHPAGDHVATAGFDRTWRLWSARDG